MFIKNVPTVLSPNLTNSPSPFTKEPPHETRAIVLLRRSIPQIQRPRELSFRREHDWTRPAKSWKDPFLEPEQEQFLHKKSARIDVNQDQTAWGQTHDFSMLWEEKVCFSELQAGSIFGSVRGQKDWTGEVESEFAGNAGVQPYSKGESESE